VPHCQEYEHPPPSFHFILSILLSFIFICSLCPLSIHFQHKFSQFGHILKLNSMNISPFFPFLLAFSLSPIIIFSAEYDDRPKAIHSSIFSLQFPPSPSHFDTFICHQFESIQRGPSLVLHSICPKSA
jgi:hypothetical protein